MKNTGVILANDANAERLKSVVGNLHRLGVTHAIISHHDGRQFPKVGLLLGVSSLLPDLRMLRLAPGKLTVWFHCPKYLLHLPFPQVVGGFDRVLLDAPCSGTGIISKDPAVKTNKVQGLGTS